MVAERSTPSLHSAVEPKQTWRLVLDRMFRSAMPTLLLIAAIILLSAPFGVPGQEEVQFGMALCVVWFWGQTRPRLMPTPAVFLCGVVLELYSFGPPGLALLALLVFYGVARHWRYALAQVSAVLVWLIFALFVILTCCLQWLLVCIHAFAFLSPMPGVFQAALTIGLYPSLMALFSWGSRTFANPDRA